MNFVINHLVLQQFFRIKGCSSVGCSPPFRPFLEVRRNLKLLEYEHIMYHFGYQDKTPRTKTPGHKPQTKTPWTKTPLAKNPPDKNPPEKTYEHKIYFT